MDEEILDVKIGGQESKIPQHQIVMQTLAGMVFSMAIKCALELGVFSAIKDGVSTLEQMAVSLNVNRAALKRLLKALCAGELLHEVTPNEYHVTKSGATLQVGPAPESLEPIARYMLSEIIVLPMVEMGYSIRTGKPSFDKIMGRSWYEKTKEHSDSLAIMDKAMENYSKISLPDILAAYQFTEFNVIVDIAGGMGQMLAGILEVNKKAKGILYDTPETIERAKDHIELTGLAERCQLISGDMFINIPSGGDLYIISKALNDWDDEYVVRVLKNVRTVMGQKSKLILIEQLADEGVPTTEEAVRNLIFLVCTPGGFIRTRAEFTKLIEEAALQISRVLATKSGFSVIECTHRVKEEAAQTTGAPLLYCSAAPDE